MILLNENDCTVILLISTHLLLLWNLLFHCLLAGPVWDDKAGATGFGAKLVTEWVRRQGE